VGINLRWAKVSLNLKAFLSVAVQKNAGLIFLSRTQKRHKESEKMREIKFRAWDGEGVHYIGEEEDLQIVFGAKNEKWSVWSPYEEVINGNDSESVLMQYTGLKDKNGKEIYEGDILDFRPFHWSVVEVVYHEYGFKGKYEDSEGNTRYAIFSSAPIEKVEVIGNKHENPELFDA
jgi:uncharacterized phage protein (TIGR01671 family)